MSCLFRSSTLDMRIELRFEELYVFFKYYSLIYKIYDSFLKSSLTNNKLSLVCLLDLVAWNDIHSIYYMIELMSFKLSLFFYLSNYRFHIFVYKFFHDIDTKFL